MITVKELKQKLNKLDDSLPVIIEVERGKRFHLLTAKKRVYQAGHKFDEYCWLPIGDKYNGN